MPLKNSRIAFDARMWGHPGIGRYLRELLLALARKPRGASFIILAGQEIQASLPAPLNTLEFHASRSSPYGLAEQWELFSFSKKGDLLHVPHFNIPFVARRKLVVTIHDLIYLKEARYTGSFLGMAYVKALFKKIEKKADAVLAVSEFS